MSDYDMERRCAACYPRRLPLRYSFSHVEGWGETINISSRGALIAMPDHVKLRGRVQLCIIWPALLDEQVHLNLVASGIVVRVEEGRVAARFLRCDFRTSSPALHQQARESVVS
jgi:PilZ domain-containing protein